MTEENDLFKVSECHKIWHKFSNYITKTFGKDLYGEWQYIQADKKKLKYRNFNDYELSKRLVGYEVMSKIRRWANRYAPEIRFVGCDDTIYAGSDIILVPHPEHGITIIFIPQLTNIQNQFFLYKNHYQNLLKELKNMNYVYQKE